MFTSREITALAAARAESVAQAGVPAHIVERHADDDHAVERHRDPNTSLTDVVRGGT